MNLKCSIHDLDFDRYDKMSGRLICQNCCTSENDLGGHCGTILSVSNCLREELHERIATARVSREMLVSVEEKVETLAAALRENAEKEKLRIITVFQEVVFFIFL